MLNATDRPLVTDVTDPAATPLGNPPRRSGAGLRWLVPSVLAVIVAAGLLSLLHAVEAPATAQSRAAAATGRVAVVDMNRVLELLDEQRARLSELDTMRTDLQQRIEAMAGELHTLTSEIKVLPADSAERQKAIEEAARLEVRIKTEERFAQLLVEDRTVLILSDLFSKIEQAVADYAQREGYALVMTSDKGATLPKGTPYQQANLFFSSRRVLYFADDADISEQVATAMNNAYRLQGTSR